MRECILDASVVLKWFQSERERDVDAARRLRSEFESGRLRALAPALLWLEVLNVAARQWRWSPQDLEQLAQTLPRLGIVLIDPELAAVARWAAHRLTAYDAAYVAVAEAAGVQLVTADKELARQAGELVIPLSPGAT